MTLISSLYRRIARSGFYHASERTIDRLIFLLPFQSTLRQPRHILICAPGGGSVGDQAMLEAFVDQLDDEVILVVRRSKDIVHKSGSLPARVTIAEFPNLLYGQPWSHFIDALRLRILMRSCSSLSVIGADVMDGAYFLPSSVRRFRMAELAGRLGLEARILGFSWNSNPAPEAQKAMSSASNHAKLFARDPFSGTRLKKDGALQVIDAADLAFLVQPATSVPQDLDNWMQAELADGRIIVALNANHGVQRWVDQVAPLCQIVNSGIPKQVSFLLLPHDSRGSRSDVQLCDAIAKALPSSRHVFTMPGCVSPSTVRSIAERLSLVVTGRMHLAILSAAAGTPVVAIDYQDKVGGLFELLGISGVVPLGDDFAERLHAEFQSAMINLEASKADLRDHLPAVIERSRLNFVGLR